MKRLLAFLVVLSLFTCLFSCSKKKTTESETTDFSQEEAVTTEAVINDEPSVSYEEPKTEETTAKPQFVFFEKSKVIFDNGTYRFELPKTNFEEKFSEELLLEFETMLSMSFGVEDYYDWNTTGQNIVKDIHRCRLNVYDFEEEKSLLDYSLDQEAYEMFMDDAGLEYLECGGVATFSLKDYNEYLKAVFGPNVKQLSTKDFETAKSASEKGLKVTGFMNESAFESFYTGKDDIILVQTPATGVGCVGEYIYDVKKDGNDYYVYTAGNFENYELITDFDAYQSFAAESVAHSIHKGYLQTKTYKFACTDDGNVYLKRVDKKYLVAENAEYDYVVKSPVEVKVKNAFTEEYKAIGVLPKGTKVIRTGMSGLPGSYEVITKDCFGFADEICFEEIS